MTKPQKQPDFLLHGEQLFQFIVENVRDYAIFAEGLTGYILSWNQGVERLLGYNEAEFIGRHISLIFTPEDIARGVVESEMRSAAEQGGAEDKRWHVRKDGTRFWANGMVMPLRDEAGALRGFAKIMRDDTEQKEAEEARKRQAAHAALRADVSAALAEGDGLDVNLRRSAESIVRHLGAALARIWTYNESDNLLELKASAGMHTRVDTDHSRIPLGQYKVGRIAEQRIPYLTNDIASDPWISNKEGLMREGVVAFAGYPLLVENRIIGVVAMFARERHAPDTLDAMAVVADILAQGIQRKRVEEERERLLAREQEARRQAEEANRLKDEFLATLSHELRTPLTSILGWARMLRLETLDREKTVQALESIARNAQAQRQLVDDILDVSRIITGKLRLDLRQIDLVLIIEEAVDAIRPAAAAKAIQLTIELDITARFVAGDSDRLRQIIWNLLSNAIKFTPKNGRVDVELIRLGSHACITVSDTGQGISPEFLPHVFDRFRQADSTTTRSHSGLGLGLAIVRHLVELHGGTVEAKSSGVGRGATFTVSLPLLAVISRTSMRQVQPAVRDRARLNCPPELQMVRVLVVDDEKDACELISTVLEKCGAEVTTARSVPEALALLGRNRPDVLVSDIGMPGEDGYALIARVREMELARGDDPLPAAAFTAFAREEDRLRVLRAGFQIHVSKPVDPEELIDVVTTLAKRAGRG